MGQARAWDVCCSAIMLAPAHTSPPATTYKENYIGLKITACEQQKERNYIGLKITPCGQQKERNYIGLKINACIDSWSKCWTKDRKRPKNPTATFKEPGTKIGCREQKQGTKHAPLNSTPPEGWANHLSHPPSQNPGHTATFTPYKKQA